VIPTIELSRNVGTRLLTAKQDQLERKSGSLAVEQKLNFRLSALLHVPPRAVPGPRHSDRNAALRPRNGPPWVGLRRRSWRRAYAAPIAHAAR
jgi:hypothetical protein